MKKRLSSFKLVFAIVFLLSSVLSFPQTAGAAIPMAGNDEIKNIDARMGPNQNAIPGWLAWSHAGQVFVEGAGTSDGRTAYKYSRTGFSSYEHPNNYGAAYVNYSPGEWATFPITSQYYNNGFVRFWAKGAAGGEMVGVSMQSNNALFPQRENYSYLVPVTAVWGEDDWQAITIPLKDFLLVDEDNPLDPAPGTIQLNDILNVSIGFIGTTIADETTEFYTVGDRIGSLDDVVYVSDLYIGTDNAKEPQPPMIKVNQLGYEIKHEKRALVSYFGYLANDGTVVLSEETVFNVRNASDGTPVYTGTLTGYSDDTAFTGSSGTGMRRTFTSSGEYIWQMVFTDFKEPGEYYISVEHPNVADSVPFIIGKNIYNELLVDLMRYFYYQRNDELPLQYAGIFARDDIHPTDRSAKFRSDYDAGGRTFIGTEDRRKDVHGGWYDAGDYGKYVTSMGASAVSDLMFAYELNKDLFRDNQFNIPESGDGMPDMLNEIKWELSWIMKMEDDNTPGAFYEVINDLSEKGRYIIDVQRVSPFAGDTKSATSSLSAAAVLAHASILFEEYDPDFAAECLIVAKRAYNWGAAANANNNAVGFSGNSPWPNERDYNTSARASGIRFWAAAALLRATGDLSYKDYCDGSQGYSAYITGNNSLASASNGRHEQHNGIYGTFHYIMTGEQSQAQQNSFNNTANSLQANRNSNYYNTMLPYPASYLKTTYWWGGMTTCLAQGPFDLFFSHKYATVPTTAANNTDLFAREHLNFMLGMNELSFSFVSGYGENCVKNIFSDIYSGTYRNWTGAQDRNDPQPRIYPNFYLNPPGYTAGGVNRSDLGFLSNFAGKCYVDSNGEYRSNENAIYWNASMVQLVSVAIATSDVDPLTIGDMDLGIITINSVPGAVNIDILNEGSYDVTIIGAEGAADSVFDIIPGDSLIVPGLTFVSDTDGGVINGWGHKSVADASWAIRPKSGLDIGNYSENITVTYKYTNINDPLANAENGGVIIKTETFNAGFEISYQGAGALISITGPDTAYTGGDAEYVISAANMPPVSGIELEFELDGDYLSAKSFSAFDFEFIGEGSYGTPISWKNTGNKWIGKITLVNAGGVSGDADILKMAFGVKENITGNTDVKLNYIVMSYAGEPVPSLVIKEAAHTVVEKSYSPYDLNKDGVIDLNDLTFALQFLMVNKDDPNWSAAKVADYNGDGVIDIQDLLLILANYTIPYYS